MRTGSISRKTNETSIDVEVNLDGSGVYEVSTGIGFLDHMLEQLSRASPRSLLPAWFVMASHSCVQLLGYALLVCDILQRGNVREALHRNRV